MLFVLDPHRTYGNGLFSGSNGKMPARGCSVRLDGVGGGVSCPLGLPAEEGQGGGCGFHLSFHRINREQASNLGSKELGGFPGGSVVKNLPADVGDLNSIPGLGRSPREGNGNPLQYSCLENSMDRGPGGLQSMGSHRLDTPEGLNHNRELSSQRHSHRT